MKRGERYLSKVWLNPESGKPAVMKITKVTADRIYYRADYGLHADGEEWLGQPVYIENNARAIARYLGAPIYT